MLIPSDKVIVYSTDIPKQSVTPLQIEWTLNDYDALLFDIEELVKRPPDTPIELLAQAGSLIEVLITLAEQLTQTESCI